MVRSDDDYQELPFGVTIPFNIIEYKSGRFLTGRFVFADPILNL